MIQRVITYAFLAMLFLTTSCAGYYETARKSNDMDFKYEAAKNFFSEKKFKKASDIYEDLVLLSQGTPIEDTVNFYTGLSKYRYGDLIAAEASFDKFISEFPRSTFSEEARFLRIKCLFNSTYRYELDQTPTHKAMVVIGEFLYDNPQSRYYDECRDMLKTLQERIDRKSFEGAKLYYTMEDYLSAHTALKNVLKENADNIYREEILYYTTMASYKYAVNSIEEKQKERYMNFSDDYYNFVGEFPESEHLKELTGLFEKVQKIIKN